MPQGTVFEIAKDIDLDAVITVGAEDTNVVAVAIQFIDRANGAEIGEAVCVPFYFSSDAAGQAISAATDGGVAIGTDGLLQEFTANVAGLMTSEADGDVDLEITDSGDFTQYLNLVMPNGRIVTSGVITFAAA